MKKLIFIIIAFVLLFWFFTWDARATVYYCDCSNPGGTTGTGTFADPFVSKADIEAANITGANGDDLYFKNNTVCSGSIELDINFEGVDTDNWSIIGCYTSEGVFTCATKPIISVTDNANGDMWAIDVDGMAFVQFQDLNIRNNSNPWTGSDSMDSTGISHRNASDKNNNPIRVLRCDFYHWNHYAFITSFAGDYSIVKDNTVTECGNGLYLSGENYQSSTLMYAADNTCTDIVGYQRNSAKLDGHCVAFVNFTNSVMEDNTCTQAYTGAFFVGATNKDETTAYFRHNIFRNNRSTYITAHTSMPFGCNDSDEFTDNCVASARNNSYGNLVYGNIFIEDTTYQTAAPGTPRPAFVSIDIEPTTGENLIANNTIISMARGLGVRDYVDTLVMINNIVYAEQFSGNYLFHMEEDGEMVGNSLTIEKNLYWSGDGDPSAETMWNDANGGDKNWASWSSTRDTTSPSPANPNFSNFGSYVLTLQSGSPAIDAGTYISYVDYASSGSGSGTTIVVENPYRFHGNMGLKDETGTLIDGMLITFYDTTNGLQNAEITSVNYGTATLTVTPSISYIYDAANQTDSTKNTQVSLRFYGTAPDIGAEESNYAAGGLTDYGSKQLLRGTILRGTKK